MWSGGREDAVKGQTHTHFYSGRHRKKPDNVGGLREDDIIKEKAKD